MSESNADPSTVPTDQEATLAELTRAFMKVGLLSFGGPAAQIALMHRVVVDDKKWLSEDRFLHALNYCMVLPGPEAMQLATYVGWLLQGVRGGLTAGLLFILPGFLVLLSLSTVYVLFGGVPAVQGLLFGLQAAVLPIIAQALVNLSRKTLTSSLAVALALAAFVCLYVLDMPFPLVIAAAALIGVLVWGRGQDRQGNAGSKRGVTQDTRSSLLAALVCTGLWLLPILVLMALAGLTSVWTQQALFFSWVAMITFGGAYAVLTYVTQVVVQDFAWLTTSDMVTGLGLAESTPGPLILVLIFVGYVSAAQAGLDVDPVVAGLIGGTLTLWVTFMPCFVWIFLGAPFVERAREIDWLTNGLRGVTSAVVGVIGALAAWFAMQVLFGEVGEVAAGAVTLSAPDLSSFDFKAFAIAVLGATMLFGLKRGLFTTLLACAAAGVVATIFF